MRFDNDQPIHELLTNDQAAALRANANGEVLDMTLEQLLAQSGEDLLEEKGGNLVEDDETVLQQTLGQLFIYLLSNAGVTNSAIMEIRGEDEATANVDDDVDLDDVSPGVFNDNSAPGVSRLHGNATPSVGDDTPIPPDLSSGVFDPEAEETSDADREAEAAAFKEHLAGQIVANSATYGDTETVLEDYPTVPSLEVKLEEYSGGSPLPGATRATANVSGGTDEDLDDVSAGVFE